MNSVDKMTPENPVRLADLVSISSLNPGDKFWYYGNLYAKLKLELSFIPEGHSNAVNLKTFEVFAIKSSAFVQPETEEVSI